MAKKEFTGKTEREIIDLAVETLKLKEEDLKFEFETKKDGIFPFSKKMLSAMVTYDEELQFGNRCLILVRDLLEKMNLEAKIYLIEDSNEKIVIEIESPDSAIIIGKQGKTLEAIQTIINVIMNKNSKEWIKIIIDIGDYRNRREKYLNKLAQNYASQVKKTRKPVLLEPMNPFERRIIHMALKN
ncbi:MAG TPA: RNA-binding cell elongation regulator Jag/EloR, partial [Spirochaetota bacterium]|nr:RNA-binding cell elongation regulator Jag/EloR [Spirochaetota bacterium]